MLIEYLDINLNRMSKVKKQFIWNIHTHVHIRLFIGYSLNIPEIVVYSGNAD